MTTIVIVLTLKNLGQDDIVNCPPMDVYMAHVAPPNNTKHAKWIGHPLREFNVIVIQGGGEIDAKSMPPSVMKAFVFMEEVVYKGYMLFVTVLKVGKGPGAKYPLNFVTTILVVPTVLVNPHRADSNVIVLTDGPEKDATKI